MNTMVTFCTECREDVNYTVAEVLLEDELKGVMYEHTGKKAICSKCGSEVYDPEIVDFNMKSLYDAYRKKNGIIALEKILEIPKKYGIGKRPLSLLLGWGEMTFSRYCEGDIPSKQYSEILQKIYESPEFYLNLLEKNKDNLKSSNAYEKSKTKTEEFLGIKNKKLTKMDLVVDYLLCKCEDITPLALQKVLYYIQGFNYAFTDKFIFPDDCEAWIHGPVYREIYERYSSYKFDPIDYNGDCEESEFNFYEKSIIDSVIKNLCCYSGKTLEKFTHSEQPWIKTRGDLPASASCDRTIDKDLIGLYFAEVKKRLEMMDPLDIELYSKKMFEKIN